MNTCIPLLMNSALGFGAQLFFYILIGLIAFKLALIADNWRQSCSKPKEKNAKP